MVVLSDIVHVALREDIGPGDATSLSILPEDLHCTGQFVAKQGGVVAGLSVAALVFAQLDTRIETQFVLEDGDRVRIDDVFGYVRGPARAILAGERTALNFLQRMSGIATLTAQFVKAVAGTQTKILDTRKTAPGLRLTDKMAVKMGGGGNHRFGLYDMYLVKDNHIRATAGITTCVQAVRTDTTDLLVEVEVSNFEQLEEALALNVDRIMLDNMTVDQVAQAVRYVNGRIPLEVSGGVNLDGVGELARTGVDFISVGALTHSARALDISMKVVHE